MSPPTKQDNRHIRLERAGRVLDRWLALFERTLDEAEEQDGTVPRSTDFVSLFRACQLLLHLEELAARLASSSDTPDDAAWKINPSTFNIHGGFEEDGAD